MGVPDLRLPSVLEERVRGLGRTKHFSIALADTTCVPIATWSRNAHCESTSKFGHLAPVLLSCKCWCACRSCHLVRAAGGRVVLSLILYVPLDNVGVVYIDCHHHVASRDA